MTHDDPYQVLGIPPEAGDEEIRAAYLRKVKEYPPDRAAREFEKVRDAYEILHDPRRRTRHLLLSADPKLPLVALLEGRASERRFVGPEAWLAVLRETKS
ncbi:MAG: J domain-containing protein [Acidobacteriia bacterium]|nr:J domain-containing protein [Terriglobia bacterium]